MGSRRIAIIDPGPDVEHHVRALSSRVADADEVVIVLTHGHADHSAAAPALAEATGASVHGPAGVREVTHPLADGEAVETDEGVLRAVATPGHTRDHLCLLWSDASAVFAGDLVLGDGDTTWVAEYPGCVADYLASLERVRRLGADVLYPTHGPELTDPVAALDRFEAHRRDRIAQVARAMESHPGADIEELLDAVYGDALPYAVRPAARQSLEALVHHVRPGYGGS